MLVMKYSKVIKHFALIEQEAQNELTEIGFIPDYFSMCNADNLLPATRDDENVAILSAAKLGRARLIDNVLFSIKKQ